MSKIFLLCCFILILAMLIMATINTSMFSEPFGADWNNLHLKAIESYAKGDLSYAFIYPPLFQLLFVPLVWLNLINYVKYFQIIFPVLALASSIYLAYKLENKMVALTIGFILLASPAFFDRAFQLQPQAIEMILVPIFLLAYLKEKKVLTSLSMIYLSLAHPLGIVLSFIPLVHSYLFNKKSFKYLFITFLIIIIPASLWTLTYFKNIGPDKHFQLYGFNTSYFISYVGCLPFILLPFMLLGVYLTKKKITSTQSLFVIWFLMLSPLALIMADRWIQYSLLPLLMLEVPYTLKVFAYAKNR